MVSVVLKKVSRVVRFKDLVNIFTEREREMNKHNLVFQEQQSHAPLLKEGVFSRSCAESLQQQKDKERKKEREKERRERDE